MGQPASLELVCCTTKRTKSGSKHSTPEARLQNQKAKKKKEESDTQSDGSNSGDDHSSFDGLQALRRVLTSKQVSDEEPEPEVSVSMSTDFSMGASASCFQEVMEQEMEAIEQNLSRCIWKFPSNGKTFWNSGSKKFFAVKMATSSERRNRHERKIVEKTCLCYWADEATSKAKPDEPDGSYPIASIKGVVHMEENVLGVKIQLNAKDQSDFVLTLKFTSKDESKQWASDLKKYTRWICKRESSHSESPTRSGGLGMSKVNSLSPTKRTALSPKGQRPAGAYR